MRNTIQVALISGTIFLLNFSFAQAELKQSDLNLNGVSDSEENEVIVSSSKSLPAGEYNFQNLIIKTGAVLTLEGDPDSSESFKGVKINADNLTIETGSRISSDRQGYGGGMGPGTPTPEQHVSVSAGYGGAGYSNTEESIYGSALMPTDLGSGGGVSPRGGGAVWITANTLSNNGRISADGGSSASGGSLLIQVGELSGNGAFNALGGNSWLTGFFKGPGGGGRVAVYYNSSSFVGSMNTSGGCTMFTGPRTCAGTGTGAFIDLTNSTLITPQLWRVEVEDSPQSFNKIFLDSASFGMKEGTTITFDEFSSSESSASFSKDSTVNIGKIFLNDSSLQLSGEETLSISEIFLNGASTLTVLPERVLNLSLDKFYIATNSIVDGYLKGYGRNSGPGAPGEISGAGSYGGVGYGNLPTSVYGSAEEPTDFGSGGTTRSPGAGGNGGGAVRIEAKEFHNDGLVMVDGGSMASGGSILVYADTLSGNGTFSARGGVQSTLDFSPAPGGGGRIAIYYSTSSFTGNMTVEKSCTFWVGSVICAGEGTLVFEQQNKRRPVIIIPGVLGTDIWKGDEKLWLDWQRTIFSNDSFLDPLQFDTSLSPVDTNLVLGEVIRAEGTFNYTSELINQLLEQGYLLDEDIFLFPYDWRYGISGGNIEALKQKIIEIKQQTGSNKVDVVAHSTGGLLVKKYVADNPDSHYVGKAVFVGVPNTGAPKAIKVLLQGDGFDNPFLSNSQMKKIAKNLPVVYELAPSQQYYNWKGSYASIVDRTLFSTVTKDLNFEETKNFLIEDHDLNPLAVGRADNLHTANFDNFDLRSAGVDLYNIVGCRAGTIGKVIERRTTFGSGETKLIYDLRQTPGDGTVPLESATNLPIDAGNKFYALKASHGTMMTQSGIRQQIVNIISDSEFETPDITQDISKCKLNGKAISIFSPLGIKITDQDGSVSGLDAEGNIFNGIPNADFNVFGESKFAYLPTDDGQTYSISLWGTGDGTFDLQDADIVDNEIQNTRTYANIPVSTNLLGEYDLTDSELSLDLEGEGQTDFVLKGKANETVKMPYIFSGFFRPINDTNFFPEKSSSVFKTGSTVPVKFQIRKYDGMIVQSEKPPQWLTPKIGSSMQAVVDEPAYNVEATSVSEYRWDPESQQYIYNWNTKGLKAGYWYEIYAKLDDGNTYSVKIGLK